MAKEMFREKDLESAKKRAVQLIGKGYRYIHITGASREGYSVWAGKK